MTTPFYVSPEQLMKDRADFARKGIARGRSVVVLVYDQGILFVAENPSRALHKISEIYDRIAFAAVGRYNEFENLRIAGVRYADLRGYSYDRRDVNARGLANAFAQTLGSVFSGPGEKPFEVEVVVAEVGDTPEDDQLYRLTYDGSVGDEHGWVAMGGQAEQVGSVLASGWREALPLEEALQLAVRALASDGSGGSRDLPAGQLEVAVLDRARPRRTFRRIVGDVLVTLLSGGAATSVTDEQPAADPRDAEPGHPGLPEDTPPSGHAPA
ncbi:MAG: proteasome subunit alpha [Actinomycetes bacterium]